MNYLSWALLGMVGYSFVTLFVKLAGQHGQIPPFLVLAISTVMAASVAVVITISLGDLAALTGRTLMSPSGLWTLAAGIALSVAVTALFRALSLGPASVVVPVYGMFIVGGSVLSLLFLGEPLTVRKAAGIALAVIAIVLISGNKR
jgi:transporter family protein